MPAHGSILAVGGAEDKVKKRVILQRFVEEAGSGNARIAILPTASAIPDERATFYREVFKNLGVADAFHVPIVTRTDAQTERHAEAIASATGVFLTGGDQQRLVSVLSQTKAFEAIRQGLVGGGTVAGTSAGASAFSATMIIGGQTGLALRKDNVKLAPGLGIITRLIIDQHFSQRDRLGRLLTAVATEPNRLGVGIDEDTAIVYYGNGEIEVIGNGQVFILDGSKAAAHGFADERELSGLRPEGRPPGELPSPTYTLSGVVLHVLTEGDRFDVVKRKLIASPTLEDAGLLVEAGSVS